MNDDLISRKAVLDYLKDEREKLITNRNDVIPVEAKKGALLSIKAMMNFITQLKTLSQPYKIKKF